MHFVSSRADKFSKWRIVEWTIKSYTDGKVVSLLDEDHAIPLEDSIHDI